MRASTAVFVGVAALVAAAGAIAARALILRDGADSAAADTPDFARAGRLGLDGLQALGTALEQRNGQLAEARAAAAHGLAVAAAHGAPAAPVPGLRVEVLPLAGGDPGWTVTATAGAEWSAAARAVGSEARAWRDGATTWAVRPAGGPRVLARVTDAVTVPAGPDTAAAASGLLALAGAEARGGPPDGAEAPGGAEPSGRADVVAAAVGGLIALLAALLARRRLDAPLDRALEAHDRWRDGDPSAPVAVAGGPTARAVTSALASAHLEAERRVSRARDAILPDAHRLAAAVSAMGRGDLAPRRAPVDERPSLDPGGLPLPASTSADPSGADPAVPAPLDAIAAAAVEARASLAARVTVLHQSALAAARAAHDARAAHATAGTSTRALATTLSALEQQASTLRSTLGQRRADTQQALATVGAGGEALRRAARELRGQVTTVARRTQDLAAVAERLSARAPDADEALELLATVAAAADPLPTGPGASIPAAHALATARRGRTALAELRRELDAAASDLTSAARDLGAAADKAAPAIPEAPPAVLALFRDAVTHHLAAADRLSELLGLLTAALGQLDGARASGDEAVARLAELVAPLSHAITAWDLGDAHDRSWLAAPARGQGTDEPVALGAVREAARAAQGRLDELLRVVETEVS